MAMLIHMEVVQRSVTVSINVIMMVFLMYFIDPQWVRGVLVRCTSTPGHWGDSSMLIFIFRLSFMKGNLHRQSCKSHNSAAVCVVNYFAVSLMIDGGVAMNLLHGFYRRPKNKPMNKKTNNAVYF